jgi:hypothetical protein
MMKAPISSVILLMGGARSEAAGQRTGSVSWDKQIQLQARRAAVHHPNGAIHLPLRSKRRGQHTVSLG